MNKQVYPNNSDTTILESFDDKLEKESIKRSKGEKKYNRSNVTQRFLNAYSKYGEEIFNILK